MDTLKTKEDDFVWTSWRFKDVDVITCFDKHNKTIV